MVADEFMSLSKGIFVPSKCRDSESNALVLLYIYFLIYIKYLVFIVNHFSFDSVD